MFLQAKAPVAIYQGDFILGKGNAVSELTLITRDPKCHVSKLKDVWRSDDTYIFGPRISHNWTIESPWTLQWVHSISECIIRIDIFCSWAEFHIGSLTYGVRATIVEMDKWKPLKLSLHTIVENQQQYCFPGELQRLEPPSNTWRCKGMDSYQIHILFFPFALCRRQMELRKWLWNISIYLSISRYLDLSIYLSSICLSSIYLSKQKTIDLQHSPILINSMQHRSRKESHCKDDS